MTMRELFMRCLIDELFRPIVVRLDGGFELHVKHPELIVFIPGVDEIVVYDAADYAHTFHGTRIVSIARAGGPA